MIILGLIFPIIITNCEACSNKDKQGSFISEEEHNRIIEEKTDRIQFLKKAYDVSNQTITLKDKIIAQKDEVANHYYHKWNTTAAYRERQEKLFLEAEKNMKKDIAIREEALSATNVAIDVIVEVQRENKRFFGEILNEMMRMNNRQEKMLEKQQETNERTILILDRVIDVSEKMGMEIERFGENNVKLLNLVANMTKDEQALWKTTTGLRKAIAKMQDNQQELIIKMIEQESERDETTKMVITSMMDLISQDDLWGSIQKDNLLENVSKLDLMRVAIEKGIQIIAARNTSLAQEMKDNFESAMDEIKLDIGWSDGQSVQEWISEPAVKRKMIKDLREKALLELKNINTVGLNDEELAEAKAEVMELRKRVNNSGAEMKELIEGNNRIGQMKVDIARKIQENVNRAIKVVPTRKNITITDSYNIENFDIPRPAALFSNVNSTIRY